MKIIPFIFLILGSLLEIFDATLSVFNISRPDYIDITSNSIQVLFFLLAIIFSLINIFIKQEKTVYFFMTGLSLALFIARVGWLVTWLN
tara:strand:+ start:1883 stop:2149 length:267 start_codon:yes stop_codon:yes gene_type:complete